MAGFTFRYSLYGGRPLVLDFYMKDTETLTKGDLLNVETGEVDLAATGDTGLVGAFMGPKDPAKAKDGSPGVVEGTDSTTIVEAIVSPDAVYGVVDSSARQPGALLDISGATGAQTVAASSNTEFVVVERKRQTSDETRVMIIPDAHLLIKAQ
jgi:hypothetical protein